MKFLRVSLVTSKNVGDIKGQNLTIRTAKRKLVLLAPQFGELFFFEGNKPTEGPCKN